MTVVVPHWLLLLAQGAGIGLLLILVFLGVVMAWYILTYGRPR